MAMRRQLVRTFSTLVPILMLTTFPASNISAEAWGTEGHHVICNIAEALLTEIAKESVEELLPDNADGNLASVCNWADGIKRHKDYKWSAPLHFVETPSDECNYNYIRDCRDDVVEPGFCASGAINNYTTQMDTNSDQHNLTEALMFLAHFVADIHQPLHVGFEGDHGGSAISLRWYSVESNLHHVWDTDIITEAKKVFFDGDISRLTRALLKNIKTTWKAEAKKWSTCGGGEIVCPDEYASESIELACKWAYPDAKEGGSLSDAYFQTRNSVVLMRMAQAAVRLAAVLNTIYSGN